MGALRDVVNPGMPRVAIVGDRYYSESRENWADVVEVQPVPHVGGEDWRVQLRYHFPVCPSWGGMGFSLASPTVMHLISNDGCVFFVGHNVAYEGSLYSIYRPGGERVAFRRFSSVQISRAAISPSGDVCCYLTYPSGDPDYDSILVALSCVDGSELYRFKVGSGRNVPMTPIIRSVGLGGVEFVVDGSVVAVGVDGGVVYE